MPKAYPPNDPSLLIIRWQGTEIGWGLFDTAFFLEIFIHLLSKQGKLV